METPHLTISGEKIFFFAVTLVSTLCPANLTLLKRKNVANIFNNCCIPWRKPLVDKHIINNYIVRDNKERMTVFSARH